MSGTETHNVATAGRPRQAKKPRMSRKMAHALEMFISGSAKTQQEAADKAGISREHFCRALKTDHVRAFIVRRTGEMFSTLLPKAFRALDLVLDGENKTAALAGALAVLKQHGIISPDGPSVSISLQAPGYVIDLGGAGGPVIDGQVQPHRAADGAQPPAIDVTPSEPADGDDDGGSE